VDSNELEIGNEKANLLPVGTESKPLQATDGKISYYV
jgi:hypothetical protein